MPFWQLDLFSYTAVLLGQRQLLLSLLGFLLVLVCSRICRRHASASLLAAWLFFLSWLVWAPLVFTPERLQGIQAPLRDTLNLIAPVDVFTLCSQSVIHHHLRMTPSGDQRFSNWNLALIAAWSAFACWRILHLWLRRRPFVAIADTARLLDEPRYIAMTLRWREALRIRRPVQLRTSEGCEQAFTVGVMRPVIHVPGVFLRELTAAGLDAVIGHEMAHVKRCDDLVICIQRLLRALFFFNPVIGVASRRIAELREQCCDRMAIERGRLSAKHYGATLLRTVTLGRDEAQNRDVIAGLHSSPLRRRIESLTRSKVRFSPVPLAATALMLATLSLLLGHTGPAPISALESSQVLAGIGAVSPVPGRGVTAKPFIWSEECLIGRIRSSVYHPGVDFATPAGQTTAIRALAQGEVTHVVQREQPSGWQIHIAHADGVASSYMHLDNALVQPGDRVSSGQSIAVNRGEEFKYVHVEVHHRGRLLDPTWLFNAN